MHQCEAFGALLMGKVMKVQNSGGQNTYTICGGKVWTKSKSTVFRWFIDNESQDSHGN